MVGNFDDEIVWNYTVVEVFLLLFLFLIFAEFNYLYN